MIELGNRIDKQIDALVSALTDPIITWPSPWMETIPESLKSRVPLERLAKLIKGDDDLATDVEALIYLYPRCLEAPLDHDWAEIYLYLGTKVMGDAMPSDIRRETLTEEQERKLNELKTWIRERQRKAVAERRRTERAQAEAEAAAKAPAQLGLGI